MNYNLDWTAKKIYKFLIENRDKLDEYGEMEFRLIKNYFDTLENVDVTPDWVLIIALGILYAQKKVRIRVWMRDQKDISLVKVRLLRSSDSSDSTCEST